MNTIKFFTPVDFKLYNDSPAHALLEACDDLLSFGSIKAEVIGPFDKSHNFYPVQLKQKTSTMVATAFKIFCLMTVVISVIALVCKIFLRSAYEFKTVAPKAGNATPPSTPSTKRVTKSPSPVRGATPPLTPSRTYIGSTIMVNSGATSSNPPVTGNIVTTHTPRSVTPPVVDTPSMQLLKAIQRGDQATFNTLLPTTDIDEDLLEKLILESAKTGSLPVLQTLLSLKGDMVDAVMRTKAIIEATESGHKGIIEKLLEGDPVLSERERFTALRKALEKGHDDIFNILVVTGPAITTKEKRELIHIAANHDRNDIVIGYTNDERFQYVCLQAAIIAGKGALIDRLITTIEAIDPRLIKDFDLESAIQKAVTNGHITTLMKLVKDRKIEISNDRKREIFREAVKLNIPNLLDTFLPFFSKMGKGAWEDGLIVAASLGNFEMLVDLHEMNYFRVQSRALTSHARDAIIRWATHYGNLDVIQRVLPVKNTPNNPADHLAKSDLDTIDDAEKKYPHIAAYLRANW